MAKRELVYRGYIYAADRNPDFELTRESRELAYDDVWRFLEHGDVRSLIRQAKVEKKVGDLRIGYDFFLSRNGGEGFVASRYGGCAWRLQEIAMEFGPEDYAHDWCPPDDLF